MWVDLAGVGLASAEIKAPIALELRNGRDLAVYFGRKLTLQGHVRMFTGSQLSAQDIAVTGSIIMRQARLLTDKATIVGNTRVYDGANFAVMSGSMRASAPLSQNYDDYMVLEVGSGFQATLGQYATEKRLDVKGYMALNNAWVTTYWTQLNADSNMEASVFLMEKSNFVGLGRDSNNVYVVNLSSQTNWRLRQ